MDLLPIESKSLLVSSAAMWLRSATTTLAPSLARTRQTALPIPLPPPVFIENRNQWSKKWFQGEIKIRLSREWWGVPVTRASLPDRSLFEVAIFVLSQCFLSYYYLFGDFVSTLSRWTDVGCGVFIHWMKTERESSATASETLGYNIHWSSHSQLDFWWLREEENLI